MGEGCLWLPLRNLPSSNFALAALTSHISLLNPLTSHILRLTSSADVSLLTAHQEELDEGLHLHLPLAAEHHLTYLISAAVLLFLLRVALIRRMERKVKLDGGTAPLLAP